MVQGLGPRSFTVEGPGSIPGWGTKIPQAVRLNLKDTHTLTQNQIDSNRKQFKFSVHLKSKITTF